MPGETTATDAPNRCDVIDGGPNGKPDPTQLCMFMSPMTTLEMISRTADYGKDPKAYLEGVLGADALEKRRDLLSIPEKVDRDIYGGGEHKAHFERHIAKLLGKEYGLFFITGIQAQLAAVKVHCDRAGHNRAAWHISSHLESAEERAFEALYGLERILLGSEGWELPSVEDIKEVVSLPPDRRPAVILVELPNRVLGCKTYTFAELEEISSACKENDVKFHCDGARLWEIEPWYQKTAGKTFADVSRLFDTVYVSFYKGLRGATGAILICGDEMFVKEAKMWQRRAGGNAFTLMYEVIDCERGYNENIGTFERKWAKMDDIVTQITAATKKFKTPEGGKIVNFMPEKSTCCQIRTVFGGHTTDELAAARDRVQDRMNVRVFERVWPKKSLDEKAKAERDGNKATNGDSPEGSVDNRRNIIEWMIVSMTEKIETKVFVDAYVALCEELIEGSKDDHAEK